jgi:hypothetical protein
MSDKTNFCLNCETPLPDNENFCPSCGQSSKKIPLGIKDIGTQIVFTIFNLDTTLFRTLALLPTPWVLTKNYIAGKRIPYYHPGRMFIILLFLVFSVITVFNIREMDLELGTDMVVTEEDFKLKDRIFFLSDSLHLDTTSRNYLLKSMFEDRIIPHDTMMFEPFIVLNISEEEKKIPLRQAVTLPLDSLFNMYNINGFWQKLYYSQFIKMYKNNQDFITYFIQKVLWTVPLSIIFLSLFMKLLYWRGSYFIIEHIVFLMHLHSSAFSFYILLITLDSGFHLLEGDWVNTLYWLVPLGLSIISLRNYYGQGLLKTSFKFILMTLFYGISLALCSVLILIFSIFMY